MDRSEVRWTLCKRVTPQGLRAYLEQHGWESYTVPYRRPGRAVKDYRHNDTRVGLISPDPGTQFVDTQVRVAEAVIACANVEDRCDCLVLMEMLAMSLEEATGDE